MTDILARPEPQTEDEAAIATMLDEIQHLRKLMDADQVEIERLRAESQQIKAETQALKAETRAILANLKEMMIAS